MNQQWHVYQTGYDDRGYPHFVVLPTGHVPVFRRVATCSTVAGAHAQKDALQKIHRQEASHVPETLPRRG